MLSLRQEEQVAITLVDRTLLSCVLLSPNPKATPKPFPLDPWDIEPRDPTGSRLCNMFPDVEVPYGLWLHGCPESVEGTVCPAACYPGYTGDVVATCTGGNWAITTRAPCTPLRKCVEMYFPYLVPTSEDPIAFADEPCQINLISYQ
jgi:hypothetical protein